jgi:hypothetical protein
MARALHISEPGEPWLDRSPPDRFPGPPPDRVEEARKSSASNGLR